MKVQLEDDDYVLSEGAAWIEVDGFAIRIHSDSGVVAIEAYEPQEFEDVVVMGEPVQSMRLRRRAEECTEHRWECVNDGKHGRDELWTCLKCGEREYR